MTHLHSAPASPRSVRLVTTLLAGSLALAVAGCGDDSNAGGPVGSVPPTTVAPTIPPTVPPTTAPPTTVPGIDHPTGADDVVLRIGYEGGFVPMEMAFANLPTILVTGDGRLIAVGPQIEIYPGPLLPNVLVRTITEDGVQQLLQLAADHGLLTQRTYENPTNIADAPDTVVLIAADGGTYEHRAYALSDDEDGDEVRQALSDFVKEVTGTWMLDNPELGPETALTADTYLVRSFAGDDPIPTDPPSTVVQWPEGLPGLDGATDCMAVPAADVAALFADADQLTLFHDGDVDYRLSVKPQLPGDSC